MCSAPPYSPHPSYLLGKRGRRRKKWDGGGANPANRSERGAWARRRGICLPLVPSLSWLRTKCRGKFVKCEGGNKGTKAAVQFLTQAIQREHAHPKIPSPYQQVDCKISDGTQALRPYWEPPEVAKIKGQGPRQEGEWGDSLSVGALTLGSHYPSALSPCLQNGGRKGKGVG